MTKLESSEESVKWKEKYSLLSLEPTFNRIHFLVWPEE